MLQCENVILFALDRHTGLGSEMRSQQAGNVGVHCHQFSMKGGRGGGGGGAAENPTRLKRHTFATFFKTKAVKLDTPFQTGRNRNGVHEGETSGRTPDRII